MFFFFLSHNLVSFACCIQKATRILEIGTFTGSTALAFACTAAANANLRPGRPLSPAAAAGSADPAPAASPGGLSEEVVGTGVVNGKSEFTGPMKHPILTDPSLLPTRGRTSIRRKI